MAEEEQGFVIRDRRGSSGSDAPSASVPETKDTPSSSTQPADPSQAAPSQDAPSQDAPAQEAPALPVTFASFVISLGSSSMMLMGEQLDPRQEAMPVNLPQAKEIIDLLSVLEEKTKGNLTSEEQTVLRDMLYALRMKYVTLASPK